MSFQTLDEMVSSYECDQAQRIRDGEALRARRDAEDYASRLQRALARRKGAPPSRAGNVIRFPVERVRHG